MANAKEEKLVIARPKVQPVKINEENQAKAIKKLLNYQIPHLYQLIETIKHNNCILDASDTGTGKTYTSIALAMSLGLKPFIICPKSVIPSWMQVARFFDTEIFGIANYEMLMSCKYYTMNMEKVKCPYMYVINKESTIEKMVNGVMVKKKVKFKEFKFLLPRDTIVIFDEAHRCKNHKTLTSRLLQGIIPTNRKILLVSATISDKIECFKPFGKAFGFFDDMKKFKVWMRRKKKMNTKLFEKIAKKKGIRLSPDEESLIVLNSEIFPHRGSRMKIAELGDMFPKNTINTQSYLCKDYEKVQEAYDIINESIEELSKKEKASEWFAKLIYARMNVEMYKVSIFIDLAEEALANGYSVIIFVNYLETMNTLAHHLKTDCLIHGSQSLDERQSCIDDFQNNKSKIIICIMKAGGVGISLHDIHGGHPRMSIISPTWSGQDTKQALGRAHRAGSKTPVIQKLVFCANTYEDKISEIIEDKIRNIDTINDKDLCGGKYDQELLTDIELNLNLDQSKGDPNKKEGKPEIKELKKAKKKFTKRFVKAKKNIPKEEKKEDE